MDLSGLKWPIIIALVVLLGWLGTGPGISWMQGNFEKATPGEDATKDETDEAGLTRLAGYALWTFQYEKALEIMESAISRYDKNGKNYWFNQYRLVKCYEKRGTQEGYQAAYNILRALEQADAEQFDDRVPNRDNLSLRAAKLKEVHDLP
jgi:hypothetical protein